MSLLDDVSIVVTPNGYKAGTLFGVIPVPTEGSNVVVNGDFATDSNWTKGTGWTISGGSANCDGSQTGTTSLTPALDNVVNNVTYIVEYTISNYTSGSISIKLGNTGYGEVRTANGTYTEEIKALATTFPRSQINADASFVGSIDNVSVKEYTSADMDVTRATAATRVDENGLVNYAEVLGGEEITCGDFSCAVPLDSWTVGSKWSIGVSGARLVSSTSAASSLVQSNVFEIGKIYKVTLDAVVISGKAKLEGSGGSAQFLIEETKTYTEYFVASKEDFYLNRVSSVSDIYIDNISVKEVTRDNVPRIDYTGGGCPHILAEPQRTNEIVNSNTSDFGVVRSTRGVQETKLGIIEGYKYSYTSANPNINKNYSESTLGYKTLSIYFDATNSDYCKLNLASGGNGGAGANVVFTPSTQTFGSIGENATYVRNSSANFESLGNNIYRIMLTTEFISYLNSTTFPIIYFGDNSNVWIGGVQVEQGSYATSYIPTSGSTVTRNQDIFTRDGIGSLINSTEGVLFVEMALLNNTGNYKSLSISDGTTDNRVTFENRPVLNQIKAFVNVSGTNVMSSTQTLTDVKEFNKMALKWKQNDFAWWVNGVEIYTDTSGNTFSADTLNRLAFDRGDGFIQLEGKVKQLQVYNTALTDTQLAALTS